jgi:hypothetical protein
MTRKPHRHTTADHLARLLHTAYLAAWVQHNPTHNAPGWETVSGLARAGFRAVAEELLRRGVRPPLEDVPEPVQWLSEKKENEL